MKSMSKKLLCMALVLCMLAGLAPMTALAADADIPVISAPTAEGAADTSEVAAVIGSGAQSISEAGSDEKAAEDLAPGDFIDRELYPSDFFSIDYATNQLTEAIKLRKEEIYIYLKSDSMLENITLDVMFLAASGALVNTYGGDYLLCSLFDYGYYAEYIEDGGNYYYIIGYAVMYSTTAEQEQELAAKIQELQPTVLGDAVNEYQKIKAIHDYIINNVEYDMENTENAEDPLPHTAYAALMQGKATAQGYVMLFDIMARIYGISSNIIVGTVKDIVFMWNIVRCDDVWYNMNIVANELDSTDVYFMKGRTDFPDGHTPADVYLTEQYVQGHPMAETAYVPEKAMSGKAGANAEWYYNAVTNELHVSGSGRMDDEVQIPNIYGGNPALVVEEGITYIGKNAFNSKSLKSVQLPDSLTEIGDYAFAYSNVSAVSGGGNVAVIGNGAFLDCYALVDYTIPDSVSSIGTVAFYGIPMEEVYIPANVTTIGPNAFYHENMTGYRVDENNTAFCSHNGSLYSKDLTEIVAYGDKSGDVVIELPNTVTVIGAGAFSHMHLSSIYIPPSVTAIKKDAFPMQGSIPNVYYGGTQKQWGAITIEEGNDYLTNAQLHTETYAVSGIGWYLDLSDGAMTAGGTISSNEGVFAWDPWRDKISSVEFDEHTYWFESGCFKNCANLKTIRFNSDHLAIFGDAFAGCTALTDVYYNESESKWKEDGNDKAFPDSPNMTMHYKAQPVSGSWGDNAKWTYDEKSGVLVISGQGVITGENRTWEHWADYVKEVIIHEGITEIGPNAFYGCISMVRIVIPEGVTAIGQYAFHAAGPNDITIPVSLKSVYAGTFMSGGLYIDVHYKGTEAQWNAIDFATDNAGLTEADIHFETTCDHDMAIDMGKTATCTEEGLTMSKYCKTCNEVFAEQRVLPKAAHEKDWQGCKYCGVDVFAGRESAGDFGNGLHWEFNTIDNRLTVSGEGAIPDYESSAETPWSAWTTDIKGVWIKDGITSIGSHAFSDCVNMGYANVDHPAANIGNYAFANCVALVGFEIGNQAEFIGAHAFDGCFRLLELTVSGAVKSIEKNAFSDTGLIRVTYKGSEAAWNEIEIGSGNEALLNADISFAQPVDYVENPFTDVANTDWFANPVLWAFDTGVTGGTSATTFGPNNFCTRAQVVTFLYAAAGKREVTAAENPFEDVADDAWYAKPVLWAVENGITSGIDATHFGPDVTCTRAQVVTFLYAAAGKPDITASSTFDDVADTDWYAKPVIWAKENDVTGGISATEFGPNQTCTRAQVVTFLYKVYG